MTGVRRRLGLGRLAFHFGGRVGVLGPADADVVTAVCGFFSAVLVRPSWESALAAATPGGADSLAVTATEQLNTRSNPELLAALRNAETLAICDALAPH